MKPLSHTISSEGSEELTIPAILPRLGEVVTIKGREYPKEIHGKWILNEIHQQQFNVYAAHWTLVRFKPIPQETAIKRQPKKKKRK